MIYLESSRVQYGPLGIETRDPIITEREKEGDPAAAAGTFPEAGVEEAKRVMT